MAFTNLLTWIEFSELRTYEIRVYLIKDSHSGSGPLEANASETNLPPVAILLPIFMLPRNPKNRLAEHPSGQFCAFFILFRTKLKSDSFFRTLVCIISHLLKVKKKTFRASSSREPANPSLLSPQSPLPPPHFLPAGKALNASAKKYPLTTVPRKKAFLPACQPSPFP